MRNSKLIPFLCLLLVSLPAAAAGRKAYPMNVPAPGVRAITFDVQEGDFVLRGDPSARDIRMRVSIDRAWIFKLGEEDILKKLIKVEGEGTDHVTIRTNIEPSWKNWFRAEYPIDFEITVPADARLVVHDTSGKIEISSMRGDVEIADTSGTLNVRDVGGALNVGKESGDIYLTGIAGPTMIESRSGQMRLRNLGALEIAASDGNLDISGVRKAELHNRGGNIRIAQVAGALTIDDDGGEIVATGVSGPTVIHDTSGQIRLARVAAVTVFDTSGDLRVRGAASLDVKEKESGEVKLADIAGPVTLPPGITAQRE